MNAKQLIVNHAMRVDGSLFSPPRETSATTHVILGQFKTCVILLGGFFLFGSNPGKTSICGAIVAIVGMSFYTHLNLLRQQDSAKASSRQSSFLLPKSKLSKENGESHNGHRDELVLVPFSSLTHEVAAASLITQPLLPLSS
ncbi:hypothetical protein RJ640_019459 [Escallonia rubra]|uniref:Uncharacterized protein n=1 Tax=Escallonia rubra TaxID=112253 RepID=A0AA88QZX4_9ASTE|nr:hypothetical protein RJ640_019459 [Escallonia rubra]